MLDDVLADPVVRFQRTFYIPLAIVLWGVMPTYVFHYLTGISFWESFLFAVIYRYVVCCLLSPYLGTKQSFSGLLALYVVGEFR